MRFPFNLYIENHPLSITTQFNSYLCFVQDRIILLLTFKSLQLPFFPWHTTNYIPKRYFIIFTNTKGLQLFPEKLLLYDIICEIMLQIYCILAITQYCRPFMFAFLLPLSALYLFIFFCCCVIVISEIIRINRNKFLLEVVAIS